LFASSLMLTPRCARGQPFGCPNSLPANSSTTLPPLRKCSARFPGRSCRRIVRIIPDAHAHPSLRSEPAFGCPNSHQANSSTALPPLRKYSARFRDTHACASTSGFVVKQTRRGEPPMIIGCPHR